MSDTTNALVRDLVAFANAPDRQYDYNKLVKRATRGSRAAAVITRLASLVNSILAPLVVDQLRSSIQSLSGSTASSTSSVPLAGSEGRPDSPISTFSYPVQTPPLTYRQVNEMLYPVNAAKYEETPKESLEPVTLVGHIIGCALRTTAQRRV